MNILYICALDNNNKAGLFNATIDRIKIVKQGHSIKVYNPTIEFSSIKSFIMKNIYNINSYKHNKKCFESGVEYENLIFKSGISDSILKKIGIHRELDYYIKNISRFIKSNDIDVIHAHWVYPQGYIAMKLSEIFNIPYIVTAHGSDIHTAPVMNNQLKIKTIEVLNNASKVFFVSEKLKKVASDIGYSKNNYIISNNGIDLNLFSSNNNSMKKKKVGYLGNLVDVKGVMSLPKIFKLIEEKIDIDFEIIGDGCLKRKLEYELKQNGVKCKFHGRIEPKEVPNKLAKFDVLIVPSKEEGWGCVIIEAFALGVNVVASNIGGIPEAIDKYGVLVNRDNKFEENMAKEAINLLENPFEKDILKKYAEKFDWQTIVKRELTCYDEYRKKED